MLLAQVSCLVEGGFGLASDFGVKGMEGLLGRRERRDALRISGKNRRREVAVVGEGRR